MSDSVEQAAAANGRADAAETREREAAGRYRRSWYVVVLAFVYLVAGPAIAIGISAYNQHQSARALAASQYRAQQAMCQLVVMIDDGNRAGPPPVSEFARRIARAMSELRRAYGCVPAGPVVRQPLPSPSRSG